MARCSNKSRALQVFEIYKELTENTNLVPAVIYSGIENQKDLSRNHKQEIYYYCMRGHVRRRL